MDKPRPLYHHDAAESSDEDLQREARAHLAKHPSAQVMAELLAKLRMLALPWWSADFSRATWSPVERMRWFSQRPDIRQRITTTLTGLPANTARKKTPEFQAELIAAVLESGDLSVDKFEEAFEPTEMAVYAPVADIWTQFRDRMPWEEESPLHQKLVAWLMRTLLADRCMLDGSSRKPVLTPWDIRSAIDTMTWQTRIPADIRAAVDEARMRQEKTRPRDPFTARHELLICTPEQIAASVPLSELAGVFTLAERAMGFDPQDAHILVADSTAPEGSLDEPAMSMRPQSSMRIPRVA